MPLLDIFKKKDIALPKEPDQGPVKPKNPMEAELHEGYDPDGSFKERTTVISSAPYHDESTQSTASFEKLEEGGFTERLIKGLMDLFENKPNDTVFQNQSEIKEQTRREMSGQNSTSSIQRSDQSNIDQNFVNQTSLLSAGTSAEPVRNSNNTTVAYPAGQGSLPSGGGGARSDSKANDSQSAPDVNQENPDFPVTEDNLSVNVSALIGEENTPLQIIIGVEETGSYTGMWFRVSGLPAGSALSAGQSMGNGAWRLSQNDLQNLEFIPASSWSGSFNLQVAAFATDSQGDNISVNADVPVTIKGEASPPILNVHGAHGLENGPIALVIDADLTDTDGSENLSIVISGVPTGGSLSAGTHNADGTWTLTPSQLAGLLFTPPLHFSGSLDLHVTAISSEDGTTSSVSAEIHVEIDGVATAPALIIQNAVGYEDAAIPLIIQASKSDPDGETLSVIIGGMPSGAVLSTGIDNHDGTWTLTPGQLTGLTLTPPADFYGQINLSVIAITSENGTVAQTQSTLQVDIANIADTPFLSVTPVSGLENSAIELVITVTPGSSDLSENISVIIGNLPAGTVLSAGIDNHDGTWTLTPADLAGLTLTPPAGFNGTLQIFVEAIVAQGGSTALADTELNITVLPVAHAPIIQTAPAAGNEDNPVSLNITVSPHDAGDVLTIVIGNLPVGATLSAGINNGDGTWTLNSDQLGGLTFIPATDWNGNLNLTVSASASRNGTNATTSTLLPLTVHNIADAPVLTVMDTAGNEDTTIALHIDAALAANDPQGTLVITIENVPAGAVLSAGTDNHNGTWTLMPAQLSGLTLTPPLHFDGDISLIVTATASDGGVATQSQTFLDITVSGIATTPALNVSGAAGLEDMQIPLSVSASLADADSETLTIIISGVPAGAILSAGTNSGNGTWVLTPADLLNLSLTPALNFSGQIDLTVTAMSHEGATTAQIQTPLTVSVSGIADVPNLSVQSASGTEGSAVLLNIAASLNDTDGSESLSVIIGNMPTGAVLSTGMNNGDGTWTVPVNQLSGLTLVPPVHYSGAITLSVIAVSSESGTSAATSPVSLPVTIAGVAQAPDLIVSGAAGFEDTSIALPILAAVVDAHENLSVVISGVPLDASLSAGVNNGNGSWTLTQSQLANLSINPPSNFSGTITLTVTGISSQDGTTAQSQTALTVSVSGVPDVPNLSVQNVTGVEGHAVILNIAASLNDADGSENISVIIGNVPDSVMLSAGVNNGDGTWTLMPQHLSGLSLNASAHFNGVLNLSVTATASESGTTASTSPVTFLVTVEGVADAPNLAVTAATGFEDTAIPLTIDASLVDAGESLSIIISGVPEGAALSAGIDNGGGSWTVTSADLSHLTLSPPLNFSGQIGLTITAFSMKDGTSAQTQLPLTVSVSGVADVPNLTIQAAAGAEGSAIALNITASLADTDGSENLSVTIGNIPAGSVLSAGSDNHDGTWTVAGSQLSGLTITAPDYYSGTLNLSIVASASENGASASTEPLILPVFVTGVADAPNLSVVAATGLEDTAIPLVISASPTDADETVSVTVAGVPPGATLSAGENLGNGQWSLTPAQLSGLSITPPANWSGSFTLSVSAVSSEGSSSAHTSANLSVLVAPVADTPTLLVQAVSGNEDTAISLNIGAFLNDADGSESLSVTIAGVPSGAVLSAGANNGNGTWTLTQAQLSGLTLMPPVHWAGDIALTITANASEGAASSSISAGMNIRVAGLATTPTLNVLPASGNEDAAIPLTINAALADVDGSETLSIKISNIPSGAVLSAGTDNHDGTWTLTPSQLTGLTITPPSHQSGILMLSIQAISNENGTQATASASLPVAIGGVADIPSLSISAAAGAEDTAIPLTINTAVIDTDGSETLSVVITGLPAGASLSAGTNDNGAWTLTPLQLAGLTITPPSNYSGHFDLSVAATSSENETLASANLTLGVTVAGVADAPNIRVHAVTGTEDAPIALGIEANLADTDGSENLSITIAGMPGGFTLSSGTNLGGGTWLVTPAQLSGLTLAPPAHWSGSLNLTVTATATEGTSTASTLGVVPITIGGAADAPILHILPASGNEDSAISLNITAALTDTDGSEHLSITIGNIPPGGVLSAGVNNNNGTWTLTPPQLTGLTYMSPLNFSGLTNLTVTATSSEDGTSANTSVTLPVSVQGVADRPDLSVTASSGTENTSTALNIAAALADTDGSEILSINISGVPAGATLSDGLDAGNGIWVLTSQQLAGLTITTPNNYNGAFALTVTALSSENGTTGMASVNLPVTIAGVASAPVLSVSAAAGIEDTAIPLNINASIGDASEILSLTISGVPTGANLSHGLYAGNGKWSLAPSDLAGLSITPPANFSGMIGLTVTAISMENNGDDTSLSVPLNVTVTPIVDAPTLSVIPASGNEDTSISINISGALLDTDGSESLTYTISGVPTGAILSSGTNLGGGVWSLTAAQTPGLKITPPLNSDSDFVLAVTAKSTETSGATSSVNSALAVTVNGVADVPTISASNVTTSGFKANLTLAGSVTDSSETMTYVLHGVPDGFALNKGINNGDNSWTLKSSELSTLQLTAPEQFNGQLNLNLIGVSHDSNNSVAVSAATPFYVRFGNYSTGYLVDLGVNLHVGGIGVGVHVGVLPDIDLLPATGGLLATNGIYAKEDTSFLIADAPNILSIPVLSNVLYAINKIQFSNIPEGVTFSAGTKVNATTWQFTSAQLNNLYMTPVAGSDNDFTFLVTAKLLFGLADISLFSVPVHIMGVADMPSLSVTIGTGVEDTSMALNITGALSDTDSEILSYLVSGMPSGFVLNKGIDNGNGTWSLSASDITGLLVTPSSNYSGTANITVSAIATEREGDQSVKQQTVSMVVTAAADAPLIAAMPVTTTEDQAVTLNLGISLRDTDGSEQISSVIISGVPEGATLAGATDNHNGTWSADVTHLDQVRFIPPEHWGGDVTLSITATSRETSTGSLASTVSSLSIHIDPLADAPAVTATDSTGDMGEAVSLHLGAALNDNDGSETLTAVISGVPDNAILSAGLNNGDGTWTLSGTQLSGLTIQPPENFIGDINMTLTAFSRDGNSSVSSAHQDFAVHVMAPSNAMMMSFGTDEQDLYANQNGWVDQGGANAVAITTGGNEFFTDNAAPSNTGGDHDQAFQNYHTG